jgi:hypothetical protein
MIERLSGQPQPLSTATTHDRSKASTIAVLVFPLIVPKALFVKVTEQMERFD